MFFLFQSAKGFISIRPPSGLLLYKQPSYVTQSKKMSTSVIFIHVQMLERTQEDKAGRADANNDWTYPSPQSVIGVIAVHITFFSTDYDFSFDLLCQQL